jgi:hypothetical protein
MTRVYENWCLAKGWGKALDYDLAKVRLKDKLTRRLQARYGITKQEACRCASEWIKDPGVLDDWNDTRSILDM